VDILGDAEPERYAKSLEIAAKDPNIDGMLVIMTPQGMTNPTLIQMARTYGATDMQIFTKLCIPSALPMVFGAFQNALAYAWTNLVAAELLASDTGLGFLITMGRRLGLPEMVILGMLSVGFIGAAIGFVIDFFEKRLLAGIRR